MFYLFKHNKEEKSFIVCSLMVSITKVFIDLFLLPVFAGSHGVEFPCVPGSHRP